MFVFLLPCVVNFLSLWRIKIIIIISAVDDFLTFYWRKMRKFSGFYLHAHSLQQHKDIWKTDINVTEWLAKHFCKLENKILRSPWVIQNFRPVGYLSHPVYVFQFQFLEYAVCGVSSIRPVSCSCDRYSDHCRTSNLVAFYAAVHVCFVHGQQSAAGWPPLCYLTL